MLEFFRQWFLFLLTPTHHIFPPSLLQILSGRKGIRFETVLMFLQINRKKQWLSFPIQSKPSSFQLSPRARQNFASKDSRASDFCCTIRDSHKDLSIKVKILTSRLKSQHQGSNHSLKAQTAALRLKSHHWCLNSILELQNSLSIGHRPHWGRCPSYHHTPTYIHIGATGTADHLTLLRLW